MLTQTGNWRVKFEVYADLANMGAHLDVAEEQTYFIKHEGLEAISLTITKTVHSLLITKRRRSTVSGSLVSRRFGFEAWRVLKED